MMYPNGRLSCEMFVEIGLAVKKHSPLETTFLIELANGYNGYLSTAQQHRLGGYETCRARSSDLAVDWAMMVNDTLLHALKKVAAEED